MVKCYQNTRNQIHFSLKNLSVLQGSKLESDQAISSVIHNKVFLKFSITYQVAIAASSSSSKEKEG